MSLGVERIFGYGHRDVLPQQRVVLARGTNAHVLRHQGITRALDLTGGDVRSVRRFSRHAKLETLLRFDYNRRDEAGAIAKLLGDDPS